jgi:hypothetical protein
MSCWETRGFGGSVGEGGFRRVFGETDVLVIFIGVRRICFRGRFGALAGPCSASTILLFEGEGPTTGFTNWGHRGCVCLLTLHGNIIVRITRVVVFCGASSGVKELPISHDLLG